MANLDRLVFLFKRFAERLWVKPLAVAIVSVAAVFLAKVADRATTAGFVPSISSASLEALLAVMAASMLVIATFAVASMVAAYASASSAATPRSFSLVIADDVSQNALSTFIGAFIFSIVGLTAVKNEFFEVPGRAVVFVMTVIALALVILTFLRWVDRIARLGRVTNTIERVEAAAAEAMARRMSAPTLRGAALSPAGVRGQAIHATTAGYVQRIDVEHLQACAEDCQGRIIVAALPGTLAMPGRPLAYLDAAQSEDVVDRIIKAFVVGTERVFDEDPRFGLVVLSEIAGKALSPGINDPGTAIAILGSLTRLLGQWTGPREPEDPEYDRVEIPELSTRDMFDDAFTPLARDGAGMIEVVVRLLKVLGALATVEDAEARDAAHYHAALALKRAEHALVVREDLALARLVAERALRQNSPTPSP